MNYRYSIQYSLYSYLGGKILIALLPTLNRSIIRYHYFDILAPILCIPLFGYLQKIMTFAYKKTILISEIIGYVLVFSIVFEFYIPMIFHVGTSDIYDVFCYAIGGFIVFYLRIEM